MGFPAGAELLLQQELRPATRHHSRRRQVCPLSQYPRRNRAGNSHCRRRVSAALIASRDTRAPPANPVFRRPRASVSLLLASAGVNWNAKRRTESFDSVRREFSPGDSGRCRLHRTVYRPNRSAGPLRRSANPGGRGKQSPHRRARRSPSCSRRARARGSGELHTGHRCR